MKILLSAEAGAMPEHFLLHESTFWPLCHLRENVSFLKSHQLSKSTHFVFASCLDCQSVSQLFVCLFICLFIFGVGVKNHPISKDTTGLYTEMLFKIFDNQEGTVKGLIRIESDWGSGNHAWRTLAGQSINSGGYIVGRVQVASRWEGKCEGALGCPRWWLFQYFNLLYSHAGESCLSGLVSSLKFSQESEIQVVF